MDVCCAYNVKGTKCIKRATVGDLCGTHNNSRNLAGPNKYARNQLLYKLNGEIDRIAELYHPRYAEHEPMSPEWRAINIEMREEILAARNLYSTELRILIERQRLETETTGVNPDTEAQENRRQRRAENVRRREARRELRERFMNDRARMREIVQNDNNLLARFQEFLDEDDPAVPRERGLREFVQDPQNVHTAEAVTNTKDIIDKIRKVAVPDGYRWNMSVTSKTPGEIIAECGLSIHAACQMLTQYSNNVAIYDIEEGIYGKVLDSVWQFVKNSPDKDDLCKVIKQEMEDNVGMCAQGNLSRICNIVSGYMDGVTQMESLSEKLGRLFAELSKEDPTIREDKAKTILTENMVPHEQWEAWMEAVMAD